MFTCSMYHVFHWAMILLSVKNQSSLPVLHIMQQHYVYRYTAITATYLNTISEKFSEHVETAL